MNFGQTSHLSPSLLQARSLISPVGQYSPFSSTIGSSAYGSGKKHVCKSKLLGSEDSKRSIDDTSSGDDADSTVSWTTSSTIDTISELDHLQADPIQGAVQLVPDGHAIDSSTLPAPTLTCRFWFLNCSYASTDEMEWREHSLAHLRGHVPPSSTTCPLCDMTFNVPDPQLSWRANMSHLMQHFRLGETMASAEPESVLVRHLWAKRIITDAHYQELVGNRTGRGKESYLTYEGRGRKERRGYAVPQSRM